MRESIEVGAFSSNSSGGTREVWARERLGFVYKRHVQKVPRRGCRTPSTLPQPGVNRSAYHGRRRDRCGPRPRIRHALRPCGRALVRPKSTPSIVGCRRPFRRGTPDPSKPTTDTLQLTALHHNPNQFRQTHHHQKQDARPRRPRPLCGARDGVHARLDQGASNRVGVGASINPCRTVLGQAGLSEDRTRTTVPEGRGGGQGKGV